MKVLVRRSLYVRSLTGVLQFGAGKRRVSCSHISLTPGKPWRVFFEKDLFEKRKILKRLGKHLA